MSRGLLPSLVAGILGGATLFPMQVFGAPTTPAPGGAGSVLEFAEKNEPESDTNVCTASSPGHARCHARLRNDAKGKGKFPARSAMPAVGMLGNGGAYDPAYLQSAYNLTAASSMAGSGQVV